MIIINTISDVKFSFNGINYLKNFTPIVVGDKIRILNTYDSKIELTDAPTLFTEFSVNGVEFTNVALLQDALLLVIFTRSSLPNDGNKLDSDIATYTDVTLPLIDTDEFLVNRGGTWYKVDKSEIGGNALFLKWNHTYSENNAGYTGSSGRLVVYTVEIPSNIILDENTFIEFDAISTVEAGAVGSCTTEVHITDNVPTADLSTLIAYFNRGGTGLQQSVSRKMTMLNTTDFWVLPNNRNIQSDYSSISNSFNRMVISGFSPTKRNITVVFLKTNIADIMKFTDINIKIYQNA